MCKFLFSFVLSSEFTALNAFAFLLGGRRIAICVFPQYTEEMN